jgi:hypothetical protein
VTLLRISYMTPSLPDPQLNEHRTVVRKLIPDGFVGLAVGNVAEGGPIDPGQDSLVDTDVIDDLGKRIVPAAHGHLLRERGKVGVGGLAARSLHAIEVAMSPRSPQLSAIAPEGEDVRRPPPMFRSVLTRPS